jgi:hypothetical protein
MSRDLTAEPHIRTHRHLRLQQTACLRGMKATASSSDMRFRHGKVGRAFVVGKGGIDFSTSPRDQGV